MDLRNRNHRALLCLGVVAVVVGAIHVIRFVANGDHRPMPASASQVGATDTSARQTVSPVVKHGTAGRKNAATRPSAKKTTKAKAPDGKQLRSTDRSRQSGSSREAGKTASPTKRVRSSSTTRPG
jgi:hypothetical protein